MNFWVMKQSLFKFFKDLKINYIHLIRNLKNKATYLDNRRPFVLNYNSNGITTLRLPHGPASDSYFIYLYVHIIDDLDGKTVFNLSLPVKVTPDPLLASLFATTLALTTNNDNEASLYLMADMNSGNLNLICADAIALSIVFNMDLSSSQMLTSSLSNNTLNDQMALTREYMLRKVIELSVCSISSIKVMSSALAAITQTTKQISTTMAV